MKFELLFITSDSVIYCTARPIKSNFTSNFYSRVYGLNNTVKHYVLSYMVVVGLRSHHLIVPKLNSHTVPVF